MNKEKITKTFRIDPSVFDKFKSETSLRGFPVYSVMLEHLILCYLKEPDKYNPYKIGG